MRFAIVLSALVLSQLSLASGWRCSGEGYRATLTNSTTSPRVPAYFGVSDRQGTLLSAHNEEISKRNLSNGVRYTASGDDNFQAILFVRYREGYDAPLKDGAEVDGKLILTVEGEKGTYDLTCRRYLKN